MLNSSSIVALAGNVGRLAVRWRLELLMFQTSTKDE